jgi:hypothetical protein
MRDSFSAYTPCALPAFATTPVNRQQEKFEFSGTVPQGAGMWAHLFEANKHWGLNTIKQDHIGEQIGGSKQS